VFTPKGFDFGVSLRRLFARPMPTPPLGSPPRLEERSKRGWPQKRLIVYRVHEQPDHVLKDFVRKQRPTLRKSK